MSAPAATAVTIYQPSWRPFQIAFSSTFSTHSRCAIASFERSSSNFIHIVRLIGPSVINEATVPVIFPQTHVHFSPLGTGGNDSLLISTADCLRVWQVDIDSVSLAGSIPTDGQSEILSCADWSQLDNMVISGTTEGAVQIFDIGSLANVSRIVAHDHQVHDISFCGASPTFVTAGIEGSMRFFDLRDLMSSYVYYQTAMPLQRVAVSPIDPTKIATFSKDSKTIAVIDSKQPGIPCNLIHHPGRVTSIHWSSLVEDRLFSTDVLGNAMVSDFVEGTQEVTPHVMYHAQGVIQNSGIALTGIAIVTDTAVELVKGMH